MESGRGTWTALLDALRLGPADGVTAATAAHVREVIGRLRQAGHWQPCDPDILVAFDAGYDVSGLAFLLGDLPVQWMGRLRSALVLVTLGPAGAGRSAGLGAAPAG